MALNPVAKKWVAALRSGKYKQGKGALHQKTGNKFCCLGVLCTLAVKAKVIPAPKLYQYSKQFSYKGRTGTLPDQVAKWAGLSSNSGQMFHKYSDLTEANDGGVRFKTIAKIIESEPDGLFKK